MQCSSKCNIKSLRPPVLSPCPASAYTEWRESDLRVEVLMSVEGVGFGEGVCVSGGNWLDWRVEVLDWGVSVEGVGLGGVNGGKWTRK